MFFSEFTSLWLQSVGKEIWEPSGNSRLFQVLRSSLLSGAGLVFAATFFVGSTCFGVSCCGASCFGGGAVSFFLAGGLFLDARALLTCSTVGLAADRFSGPLVISLYITTMK